MTPLSRREWLAAALGLPAASLSRGGWLWAQEGVTFTAGVNVVNVLATVRNGKGEIVHDLTVDDFTLEEDGRPQTIRYFSKETNLPLTLGLLIDISASQWRVLPEERRASRTFLRQVLRENQDSAFLIQFARDVELIKDLTSSRPQLEAALETLSEPGLRRTRPAPGGGPPRRRFGGTAIHDAVYLATDEILRKQSGRKAVIVLSDGIDNSSKVGLEEAVESAQRSDTLVYAILFADGMGPGFARGPGYGRRVRVGRRRAPSVSRLDGKGILERISKETGGSFFEVSGKHALADIYKRIEEELRNQYSLGYTSDRPGDRPSEGGYRKIRLVAKQKGLTVQSREGYYAGG